MAKVACEESSIFCVLLSASIPSGWPSSCAYIKGVKQHSVCASDMASNFSGNETSSPSKDQEEKNATASEEVPSHAALLHVTIQYKDMGTLTKILNHPREGVGKGLFAAKNIRPGIFLCEYAGERVPWELIYEAYTTFEDTKYVWCEGEVEAIDAKNCGNEARFINHYESLAPQPNVRAQIVAYSEASGWHYRVLIKALRTIYVDQEVLLDYGPLYVGRWS